MVSGLVFICSCQGPAGVTAGRGASFQAPEERMEEFNDWKFGLFLHWGPWSQSGIGPIWRGRKKGPDKVIENNTEQVQKHLDLNKTFDPVKFDPAKWARLAKKAGMKYVVFTTKHHDGFCNFDTKQTHYRVTDPDCPYSTNPNADITKHLTDAFRKEGLAIGYYFSHPDQHHADGDWWWRHLYYDPDFVDKFPNRWKTFAEFETEQVRELLTNYGDIDILWFDIRWPATPGYGMAIENPTVKKDMLDMLAMARKINPDILINDRGTDVLGDFATPEQHVPEGGVEGYWEANITISNGGGYWYRGPDSTYKTAEELIHMLVDIASKGGNFLMNIGPRPDGTFTPQEIDRLDGMADWMAVNGESIYGTERSPFGSLEWGRCTVKGDKLYLHVFDWPQNGRLRVPGLKSKVAGAYLLADSQSRPKKVTRQGLDVFIDVGKRAPDKINSVVVVTVKGPIEVDNTIRQNTSGDITLAAGDAMLHGEDIDYFWGSGTKLGGYITGWENMEDYLTWEFIIDQPGSFAVETVRIASKDGGNYIVSAGPEELTATLKPDDELIARKNTRRELLSPAGTITLSTAGKHTLTIKPAEITADVLMQLKEVRLTKVR